MGQAAAAVGGDMADQLMFPGLASYNTGYRLLIYAINGCKLLLGKITGSIFIANTFNFIAIQLSIVPLPACFRTKIIHCFTAFANHVMHIIRLRADKKMVWITARWIVAFMAHDHSFLLEYHCNEARKKIYEQRILFGLFAHMGV